LKKCLIIGGNGGLGRQLTPLLESKYDVYAPTSDKLDITNLLELQSLFKKNTYDLIINMSCCNVDGFAHKLNEAEVNKQINVNIIGNVNIVNSALQNMRNSGGNIILFSSILAEKAVPGTSIYSGCKGFIESFVRTVAIENFRKNLFINALQLGYFDGGLTYRIPEDLRNHIQDTIPAGRFGSINEIYNTIDYIISTPYVSGSTLRVNGGVL
jgi:3-oxoacyl-[acyl-carrier protein] reductase